MREKYCAQCKNAWDSQEDWEPAKAEYEVRGKIIGSHGRYIPYHAFICDNHFEALSFDGAKLRIIKRFK